MKYSFVLELRSCSWLRSLICLFLFFVQQDLPAQEHKNLWKFGLNLGFNEAGVSCRPVQQPRQSGAWLNGVAGSCQGAWSELYSQTLFRQDSQASRGAWTRLDFDLFLALSGDRDPLHEALKIANKNLFVEVGQLVPAQGLIWAGRRSYRWEGFWLIGLNIITTEAPGLGVYNIDLAQAARLSIAGFYTQAKDGGPLQRSFDLRFEEINLGLGQLTLIWNLLDTGRQDGKTAAKSYAAMHGYKLAAIHKLWTPQSSHQFATMYGEGLAGVMDSPDIEQGPMADSMGPWRNNQPFAEASPPELRDAIQRSSILRLGEQISWYPQGQGFSIDFAMGYQLAHFGAWRYQLDDSVYDRPAMQTLALALKPTVQLKPMLDFEALVGYVAVKNGFGKRVRGEDGSIQESYRPMDQNLMNLILSLNIKPLGRWQQKFTAYAGFAQWNEAMQQDLSSGLYTDRSNGLYAGLSSYWEL